MKKNTFFKKISNVILLLLLLFSCRQAIAQCSFNTPVTIASSASVSLSGCPIRYYKFFLNASLCSSVTFDTCISGTFDTILTVYNPTGTVIAVNDDSCNLLSSVSVQVSGYAYLIVGVSDYNGTSSGSCTLRVTSSTTTITAPIATSNQSFCSGATVSNLVASGSNLKWYSSSSSVTALASNTVLQTQTYYVSQSTGTCESSRTAVNVIVNPKPAIPTSSNQSFCSGATVANLVATGTNLKWYSTA
ncbi:hypothetical protein, partial [Flavobacterium sp.]|uniref:immunoglobulin domain-containing protein n=1 Tax=Flavobacterium sp. TaxID=239 RepID=UPI003750D25E